MSELLINLIDNQLFTGSEQKEYFCFWLSAVSTAQQNRELKRRQAYILYSKFVN